MIRNFLIYIFVLATTASVLSSCSGQRNYRKGMESADIGEYYRATERLRKAYSKAKDPEQRREMTYQIAEAYHSLGEYSRAAIWYKNAYRREYPNPDLLFYAAESYRAAHKFDAAKELYADYLELYPDNQRAIDGLANCDSVDIWAKNPTRYQVEALKRINSRYSDYAAIYGSEQENLILFSSMREHEEVDHSINGITGQYYSNIFQSTFDVQLQRWENPIPLSNGEAINTLDDEGTPALSPSGDVMAFTRCITDADKNMGASVFVSPINRGNFSEAVNLNLAQDSLVAAHPYFSMTGDTLFFTSNRGGGYGGMDIWMTTRVDGTYTAPINMGEEINTPGNEVFPTTDSKGNLYFSSDYHTGFGGLDIFSAHKDANGKWIIANMKAPINSTGDDFSMTFIRNADYPKGLFTSSRKASRKDDIYSFVLPPKVYEVRGMVYNKDSDEPIDGARVRVIATDGTDLKVRTTDGSFRVNLEPETEYIFAAYKDKFLNDKAKLNTIALDDSKIFDINLYLAPTNEPISIDNINYAFGSAELEEGSKGSLDSLINLLAVNPTITVEIMAHTDHIGSAQSNSTLSQKRAQSVVNYLIEQGVNPKRLVAKGYGETWPKKVNKAIAKQYKFLKQGDVLTEQYIAKLDEEEQDIARSINRRTEFRVLTTDFVEEYKE